MTDRAPVVAIVHNPLKVVALSRWQDEVARICAESGWAPPLLLATTEEDHGADAARRAVESGVDLVCALGGDGTVREVATSLAGGQVPMGVIGLGTGNLLARNLGLPVNDLGAALRVALTGRDRQVDLGWVRFDDGPQMCFTVITGMGFDAQMMADTSDGDKSKLGWVAYVGGGLRSLVQRGFSARVVTDGRHPWTARARTVLVCNCGLLPGGIDLVPQASIDDGQLDLMSLSPRGIVGWTAVLVHVLSRRHQGHHLVRHEPASTCLVRTPGPVLAEVDGDPVGMVSSMRTRVAPGALRVRVR